MIAHNKVITRRKEAIDYTYLKHKRKRDIYTRISFCSFFLNPLISIPTAYMRFRENNKMKEESDENKNIFGELLKPMGNGHQLYNDDGSVKKSAEGLFWGIDNYNLPIHINQKEKTTHSILFGRTGSGKTSTVFSLIKQNSIQSGCWIFVDGKSENPTWRQFYDIMKELKREDEIFLLSFRRGENSTSNSWNLLQKGSSTQLRDMISGLSLSTDGGSNQVFIDRRKQFMTATMGRFIYFRDVEKREMKVSDLIQMTKPECLLRMLKKEKSDSENDEKLKRYSRYWFPDDYIERGMSTPRKQRLRDFASSFGITGNREVSEAGEKLFKEQHAFVAMQFSEKLSMLSNEYGHIFDRKYSDIDISELVKNNRCLYILLPALEKSTGALQGLGKLIMIAIKNTIAITLGELTEGTREMMEMEAIAKRPIPSRHLICDEYGSYRIRGMSDVLRQRRSLKFAITLSIQEKASLEKRGKEESLRLLGNSTSKIFLKLEDVDTIEFAVKRRGKVKQATNNNINSLKDSKEYEENDLSVKDIDIIDEQIIKEIKDGRGYFVTEKESRLFVRPYVEPPISPILSLNKLYPVVKYSND